MDTKVLTSPALLDPGLGGGGVIVLVAAHPRELAFLDARPSDSMVLALRMQKPIHVARRVLDNVEDMTEILDRILKKQE